MTENDSGGLLLVMGRNRKRFVRISVYNANITGSNTYLFKRQKILKSLIDQEGLLTIWFNFSTVDNNWEDLMKVLNVYFNDHTAYK